MAENRQCGQCQQVATIERARVEEREWVLKLLRLSRDYMQAAENAQAELLIGWLIGCVQQRGARVSEVRTDTPDRDSEEESSG